MQVWSSRLVLQPTVRRTGFDSRGRNLETCNLRIPPYIILEYSFTNTCSINHHQVAPLLDAKTRCRVLHSKKTNLFDHISIHHWQVCARWQDVLLLHAQARRYAPRFVHLENTSCRSYSHTFVSLILHILSCSPAVFSFCQTPQWYVVDDKACCRAPRTTKLEHCTSYLNYSFMIKYLTTRRTNAHQHAALPRAMSKKRIQKLYIDGIRRLHISRFRPQESNPVRLTVSWSTSWLDQTCIRSDAGLV